MSFLSFFLYFFVYCSYVLPSVFYRYFLRHRVSDFTLIYEESLFFSALFSILLTLFLLKLKLNSRQKPWLTSLSIIVFVSLYTLTCFGIAHEHRIAFGNTWTDFEIAGTFLIQSKVFFIFGFLGASVNYYLIQMIFRTKLETL